MPRPRRLGSSSTLNRSLSRLSSSSSFSTRQSNPRIYMYLIVGGLFLFVIVGFLQVRAPHGSKLSLLEKGKSDESVGADQAWWKENQLDPITGKPRVGKLGRKMGAVEGIEEGDSNDDDMDSGDEMGDDDDEEDDEQDRFDIDIDDRVLEEEGEDLEDVNLGFLAEMSNEEDSFVNSTASLRQKVVDNLGSDSSRVLNDGKAHMGKGSAIPDWVIDDKKRPNDIAGTLDEGFQRDSVKNVEKKKGSFFWDHALIKPSEENVESLATGDEGAARVAVIQLRGFKEVVKNWKERFNSDDELIDDNVQLRLDGVREIEDALLLNGDGASEKAGNPSKQQKKKQGQRGATFDPMNPVNNPMLQDPDTSPGTWMTKSDKQMLRAIRGDRLPKLLFRGKTQATVAESKSLEGERTDSGKQWGFYPGIEPSLSFTSFMKAFLEQQSCSLNFFLAWTTPAWGFTARHQRVLESILRFHWDACVVVFSETFEFDFLKSFTKEGYKVAVVRPNLQELLADTPSDSFAAILPKWREKTLFHLHYTELLRLAALYKFGGIYMDMDLIVLKPLNNLHNTVGSEITASGELRLNGAILIFDKSSPFLKKCMKEFTDSYSRALVGWNGADLLTRVASSTMNEKGSTWRQFPDIVKIEGPFSFFPLESGGISKLFAAPKDDTERRQQGELLTRVAEKSYTVHLWNSQTSNLVPEVDSLVGTILSRSCLLRCKDTLR